MEKGKLVKIRTGVLLAVFFGILAAFFAVLYNVQIVHGEEYLRQASYSVARTETVETSRGEILDSYGRVLVSNKAQYQVTLDTSLMGKPEERNATILSLLDICREQGVEWTDTLPITHEKPYSYTSRDGGTAPVSWLRELNEALGLDPGALAPVAAGKADPDTGERETDQVWTPAQTAEELLQSLAEEFQIRTEGLTDRELRDLIGVLWELTVRTKEVTYSDYVFATGVDISFITLVKEGRLGGVSVDAVSVRQYHTTYAAHLLGRVGPVSREEWEGDEDTVGYRDLEGYSYNAIVGKDGVEKAFEKYLHGFNGVREIETDSTGKIISANWKVGYEPQPGSNVVLTLDGRLQEAVEDRLAKHIRSLSQSGGGAVAIVDMSGGVLAMASYPTYDLTQITDRAYYAQLESNKNSPMLNRATMGLYAPGSIFKPLTSIAALEEGIITPTTTIRDTGIYTYYTNNYYQAPKCWIYRQYGSTHGLVNVSEAIRDSCNVFYYDVGRRLGITKLDEYAELFGLGQPSGIEVPEYKGRVAGPQTSAQLGIDWYEGATLAAAIGQENNQFTPLQLANYIAALVNGGTHYSAHLLKSVRSSDYSSVVYEYQPEVLHQIDIEPENLEAVKKGMYLVTQTKSIAEYFDELPVTAGAKTGTAQINNNTATNATFVCFAPYDDPQIAMCIVVEKGSSGGSLAALAADILQFYFTAEESISVVTGENQLMR